jgi:hypothetical protein
MSTNIEFDNLPDALAFIRENAILPPRRTPGKDEIIFEAKSPKPDGSSVDMDDLEAAIARLGGNPKRNADQNIAVRGKNNLEFFATLADQGFNFTGYEKYIPPAIRP